MHLEAPNRFFIFLPCVLYSCIEYILYPFFIMLYAASIFILILLSDETKIEIEKNTYWKWEKKKKYHYDNRFFFVSFKYDLYNLKLKFKYFMHVCGVPVCVFLGITRCHYHNWFISNEKKFPFFPIPAKRIDYSVCSITAQEV